MNLFYWRAGVLIPLVALTLMSCQPEEATAPTEELEGVSAFVGAKLFDGTGSDVLDNAVVIVRNGRIDAVGSADDTPVPEGATEIDLTGKTLTPGFIVTHGHVGQTKGLESSPDHYTEENVRRQLARYARYGVTAVVSLGGDLEPGFEIRDAQDSPDLEHARLFVAGYALSGSDPEEARSKVNELADQGVDFIKLRVDDNLGTIEKTTPEFYTAAIEQAHERGLKVAAHLFYLEDAKGLLNAGVDFLAHSVRDQEVDAELVELMKEKGVCLAPTLTREMVSFVYEETPEFFSDPFFLKEADPEVLEQLKDPERQKGVQESESAQAYKKALEVASTNVKKLVDGGVTVAFGTDSGPPTRFQGYFEHLEMELMAEAGLTPTQILQTATGNAARCLELQNIGTIETGNWADFIAFNEDPLVDVQNSRTIDAVWIAGNRVPAREEETPETE